MKHDLFEFNCTEMTLWDKFWRVLVLVFCIGALMYDLLIARPL